MASEWRSAAKDAPTPQDDHRLLHDVTVTKLPPLQALIAKSARSHPHLLRLFRVGDFYEAYGPCAATLSDVLGMDMTRKTFASHIKPPPTIAMAGFPARPGWRNTLSRLVVAGHAVGVWEQSLTPNAQGQFERELMRTFTPGTIVGADVGQYLMYIYHPEEPKTSDTVHLALLNVTYASLHVDTVPYAHLDALLQTYLPAEIVIDPATPAEAPCLGAIQAYTQAHPQTLLTLFAMAKGQEHLARVYTLEQWAGRTAGRPANNALGHMAQAHRWLANSTLAYLHHTIGVYPTLTRPLPLRQNAKLFMDEGTLQWLEEEHIKKMAVHVHSQRAKIALRQRLRSPPNTLSEVHRLQAQTQLFLGNTVTGEADEALQAASRHMHLFDQAIQSFTMHVNTRDLKTIVHGLRLMQITMHFFPLEKQEDISLLLSSMNHALLSQTISDETQLDEQAQDDEEALEAEESEPMSMTRKRIFNKGFDKAVDTAFIKLLRLDRAKDTLVAEAQKKFKNMSIRLHASLHGVYLCCYPPFQHLLTDDALVPLPSKMAGQPHEERRRNMSERRFDYTEWTVLAQKILQAEAVYKAAQEKVLQRFKDEIVQHFEILMMAHEHIVQLGVARGIALCTRAAGWRIPTIQDQGISSHLQELTHPLQSVSVVNTVQLDHRPWFLTGPNMGGKSTLLKSVALAHVLAQAGSGIPAGPSSVISLVDQIIVKAGAQDALLRGQSTFMAELATLPQILAYAGQKSLLLFDELGRGTNVVDGMAIALAIFQHIQNNIGCRMIMATHWSESAILLDSRQCQIMQMTSEMDTLLGEPAPTYRCKEGINHLGYGTALLVKAGAHPEVIQCIQEAQERFSAKMRSGREDVKIEDV